MTYLTNRNLILAAGLSLCLSACADDQEPLPETENAQNTVTELGKTRDAMDTISSAHRADVMSRSQLRDISIDELGYHDNSFRFLNEMQFQLETLSACLDTNLDAMEHAGATAALEELRHEIRAHQVSMLTMIDPDTAHAAEQVFHGRQSPLLDELDAHVDSFLAIAEGYECTF